jgi:hypothetical protein
MRHESVSNIAQPGPAVDEIRNVDDRQIGSVGKLSDRKSLGAAMISRRRVLRWFVLHGHVGAFQSPRDSCGVSLGCRSR